MTKTKCLKILFLDILTDDKKAKKCIEMTTYEGNTYAECTRSMLGLHTDCPAISPYNLVTDV